MLVKGVFCLLFVVCLQINVLAMAVHYMSRPKPQKVDL